MSSRKFGISNLWHPFRQME